MKELPTQTKCNPACMFFFVPFIIGGTWFSIIGLSYLDTLPKEIVGLIDRVFCVFTAFLDMGLAFGIAGLTVYFGSKRLRTLRLIRSLEERTKRLVGLAFRRKNS